MKVKCIVGLLNTTNGIFVDEGEILDVDNTGDTPTITKNGTWVCDLKSFSGQTSFEVIEEEVEDEPSNGNTGTGSKLRSREE